MSSKGGSECGKRGSMCGQTGGTAPEQAAKPSGPSPMPVNNVVHSGKHAGRIRIV